MSDLNLVGTDGNDTLTGDTGNDALDGGLGNDILNGGAGDDLYWVDSAGDVVIENPGEGNDSVLSTISYTLGANVENLGLLAETGTVSGTGNALDNMIAGLGADNILTGGRGNDSLWGGAGNDTYIFNLGDGNDEIHDELNISSDGKSEIYGDAGNDTLQFGSGITLDDLDISKDGMDVLISLRNSAGDSIRLKNWDDPNRRVENIAFADGSSVATADLVLPGTAGDDALTGNGYSNYIDGGAGNDTLTGGVDGRDTLGGGQGNDTYLFNRGDGADEIRDFYVSDAKSGTYGDAGNDTLKFGPGIALSDLDFAMSGADLVLSLRGSADQVTLRNWTDPSQRIETIAFDDGSSMAIGNTVFGATGADTLQGSAGNELLWGSAGNDTYLFGRGSGQDTVFDHDTTPGNLDTILFGAGIRFADIVVTRDFDNLYIGIKGTPDTLEIQGYYLDDGANRIERFAFASGSVLVPDDIESMLPSGAGTAGNDFILGTSGNDTLGGSAGTDTLVGGLGDDTYIVADSGDLVAENTDEGNDTVQTSVSYTLPDNVENLTLTNGGGRTVTGNSLDNLIVDQSGSGYNNNALDGSVGNDTLDGGAGTDLLRGYVGDDTYRFGLGYGSDTVFDADEIPDNLDTIAFGAGIAPADLLVSRDTSSNLCVRINGTTDKLTILGQYADGGLNRIERFTFADGTTMDSLDSLISMTGTNLPDYISGTAGDDSISGLGGADQLFGNDGNDTINGGTGNDMLYGGNGDDSLIGGGGYDIFDAGAGNDTLNGNGAQSDAYLFGRGYGQDIIFDCGNVGAVNADSPSPSEPALRNAIVMASDILPSDVSVTATGDGYRFDIGGTTDSLTVSSPGMDRTYLFYSAYAPVFDIKFADGTVWTNGTSYNPSGAISLNSFAMPAPTTSGDDVIYAVRRMTIEGGDGNDTLVSATSSCVLLGGDGNDSLFGEGGNDTLDGGAGSDTLRGNSGSDTYIINDSGDTIIEGAPPYYANTNDVDSVLASISYTLPNYVENLTLTGSDSINGTGNSLANVLTGNAGNNVLAGGAGNDTYHFDAGWGQDTVSENDATSGNTDTIEFGTGITADDITASSDGANLYITRNGSSDTITVQNYYAADGSGRVERFRFADGTVLGDLEDKIAVASGTSGDDTIYGTTHNDTLDGGAGNDSLIGGAGNDTYLVDSSGDIVSEVSSSGGTDTVLASATYTLPNYVENLTLSGSGSINGTGNGLANVLTGNAGNNVLAGGAGDDTYHFDAGWGQDTVSENDATSGNTDTIEFGAGITVNDITASHDSNNLYITRNGSSDTITVQNYYAADGSGKIEQFRFADGTTMDSLDSLMVMTGTNLADYISGTAGDDSISGLGGADQLFGNDGNDTIDSGNGSDSLVGGAGDDYMIGDQNSNTSNYAVPENDTLDGGAGNDTLVGGAGHDTYLFGRGYGQDLILDIGTSMAGIDGDSSAPGIRNTIIMAPDVLPSDVSVTVTRDGYRLDINGTTDSLTLANGGPHPDRSDYHFYSYYAPVFDVTFADGTVWTNGANSNPSGAISLGSFAMPAPTTSGDDAIYAVRGMTIEGGDGNDTLVSATSSCVLLGGDGNDSLFGEGGNDTLDGGAGSDTLRGNSGSDTYIINDSGDTIIEGAPPYYANTNDVDSVLASISYTLPNYVENLTLTGSDPIDGTGNSLANVLTGNAGDNQLYGNNGNDTLTGGAGSDTLSGGTGGDTYLFNAGDGSDLIAENDATAGVTDILDFSSSANSDQLWFRQVGNDLEVDIIGTSDAATISNWYSGSAYHVEQFKSADGKVLSDTQVDQLVQAMAAFAPPAAGQTTLPQEYSDALAPVLAANWTSA